MNNNGNTSITEWLKMCIEAFERVEADEKETGIAKFTMELIENITNNLKNLNEYVTWLQKAYDKEIKKTDIFSTGSLEFLSEQVHNAWWEEKKRQGFHAPMECNEPVPAGQPAYEKFKFKARCCRCHTDMYPYAELPERIKEYGRVTVRTVLDAIKKMEVTHANKGTD